PTLVRVAARADIPGLAEQPSTHGQILGTLFAFDGRLHLGYGDYSDNTGPITMSAWDPMLGAFVDLGVLPTEEVLWFHPTPDALYTTAVDPDGHQEEGGIYRLDCGAAAWHVGPPIAGAVHVYDVTTQGDTLYAGTGSLTGAPALLMASQDRGEHWEEVLRHDSGPETFSRFYFVGATPRRLFVSGRELPAPGRAMAWIREGTGPFEALLDPPGAALVPIVLGDALVIANFSGNPGRGSYLASYRVEDGALVPHEPWPQPAGDDELVAWAPQPADEDEPERLLVLVRSADGTSSVHRSTTLDGPWEPVAELAALDGGDQFVSMAQLLDTLYLGTRLGSLYALGPLG
ncbi:MAG: hypothetical protein KDK70_29435, partial [Myxococcales bacterium]|nr:hypothetical protein [Myxococcales bacterium]